MTKLLKLWQQFSQLKRRLFQKTPSLWSVHLAIGTSLVEGQYLLFSLLSFLNLTFKIVYKTYTNNGKNVNSQSKSKVLDFLRGFDGNFGQLVQEFDTMILFVKDIPEYGSFASILPKVPTEILQIINVTVRSIDVDTEFRDMSLQQITKSYLSVKREFFGL